MARKLLIVHGYSDGSVSFDRLRGFFVERGVYRPEDVHMVDYASMDDQATFRDFADRLDMEYRRLFGVEGTAEPIDVACHSTGALVVRTWLVVHFQRNWRRGLSEACRVRHLLMFAPANFGSDLARLGQSFLGRARCTFFNSNSRRGDPLESGKQVLEGLEPASPFQWELSKYDLHDALGYFCGSGSAESCCYPVVIAAGDTYGGLQARILKQRAMPGTDGTVRISGTSLNTRMCTLDFREGKSFLTWHREHKHERIPFCVVPGFNHGSIVDPDTAGFDAPDGPGTLALEALQVDSEEDYARLAQRFDQVCESTYAAGGRDRYQQFFFHVRDDVDLEVKDYFADFYVRNENDEVDDELTAEFDEHFESTVCRHSASPAHRVMMVNLSELELFVDRLRERRAKLVLDVSAHSHLPEVEYERGYYVVYDGGLPEGEPNGNRFFFPNTTTLVNVVMNRVAGKNLLRITSAAMAAAGT